MKNFMDKDFLLQTETASSLFTTMLKKHLFLTITATSIRQK